MNNITYNIHIRKSFVFSRKSSFLWWRFSSKFQESSVTNFSFLGRNFCRKFSLIWLNVACGQGRISTYFQTLSKKRRRLYSKPSFVTHSCTHRYIFPSPMMLNFGLVPSAKQRQNPCSGPPPVYPDLSTRYDWRWKCHCWFANQDERKFEMHFR